MGIRLKVQLPGGATDTVVLPDNGPTSTVEGYMAAVGPAGYRVLENLGTAPSQSMQSVSELQVAQQGALQPNQVIDPMAGTIQRPTAPPSYAPPTDPLEGLMALAPQTNTQTSASMPGQTWSASLNGGVDHSPAPPPGAPPNVQTAPTPMPTPLAQNAPSISPWAITDTPQARPPGDVVLLKNQDGQYNWVEAGGGFQSGKSYEIKRTPEGATYWSEAQLQGPQDAPTGIAGLMSLNQGSATPPAHQQRHPEQSFGNDIIGYGSNTQIPPSVYEAPRPTAAATSAQTSASMPGRTWSASLGGGVEATPQNAPARDVVTNTAPVPLPPATLPGAMDGTAVQRHDAGNSPAPPPRTVALPPVPYGREDQPPVDDIFGDLFGLAPSSSIRDINLGTMPQMEGGWAPGFESQYAVNTENTANGVLTPYQNMQLPTMQAAQLSPSQLIFPHTEQVGQSSGLQQLLSGQGFDPATMARLNAGATDSISRQAAANRGSARLSAEQAGLGGSPAEVAMTGQINRQRGDATTQALNQLAVENADRGLQNFRMGAEMDMGRETNNMQQANAMALARASQMLSVMQQNTANVQQSNMANFSAETNRQMEGAGRQADAYQQAGSQFGQATLGRQTGADQQNAANQFNWTLNQSQLDRDADRQNAGIAENRWGSGLQGLLSLAGQQNPLGYFNQGSNLTSQQQPTNILGSVLSNVGGNLLDRAQS